MIFVKKRKNIKLIYRKNWNSFKSSQTISEKVINNIKEYDNLFRDEIKSTKKLPDISEVIQKTSMTTPSAIANTEALYSRMLRGEKFKINADIVKDAVLGKKIINELSIQTKGFNARRNGFYKLALDNIF